jgi:hypothetical protein
MARPGRIASVGELQWVVPVEIGERTAAEGLLVAAELGLERGTGAAVANTRIPRARGEIEGIASYFHGRRAIARHIKAAHGGL